MINGKFRQFEKYVADLRRIEKLTQEDVTGSPQGRDLVSLCDEHASSHTSGTIGGSNIVAVHPFYYQIRVKGPTLEIARLETLLKNADRERFREILFENYLDYPYKSSFMVEHGEFDKVIFTVPLDGIPVKGSDADGFARSKENYVGGCFGDRCVRHAISAIRAKSPSSSVTAPVKDATLFYWDSIRYGGDELPYLHSIVKGMTLMGSVRAADILKMHGAYERTANL
jgi:hypothetical protein